MKHILVLGLITLSSVVFAANTFTSKEARCSITFPGEYETETTEEDGTKTISVTGIHGSMIYMLIASVYTDPIPEEENNLNEIITVINFSIKTNSKGKSIKEKKIKTFSVGGETGFYGFIKPELEDNKYQGNYYVIIRGNVMYQFTAIGIKKGYDKRFGNRFANSFRFS